MDCCMVEVARSVTEDHISFKKLGFIRLTLVTCCTCSKDSGCWFKTRFRSKSVFRVGSSLMDYCVVEVDCAKVWNIFWQYLGFW